MIQVTKRTSRPRALPALGSLVVALTAGAGCAVGADVGRLPQGTATGGSSYGGSIGSGSSTSTGGYANTGSYTSTGGIATGGTSGGCGAGQKACGSSCVTPGPGNGCSGGSCLACSNPANSQATCSVTGACDFTCNTGYSKSGSDCVADPTCTDGTMNGTETDVDCGGSTCPQCAPGKVCGGDTDCAKGPCESGICGCTSGTCAGANSCAATFDDGCGNTLDCTGTCVTPDVCYQDGCCTPLAACPATSCDPAQSDGCGQTLDCSNNCANSDVCYNLQCCTPQGCGTRCGQVTDGCGAPLDCGPCDDGGPCTGPADCVSGICESGVCVSCSDGKKNNGEADIDCAGPNCPLCASGKTCGSDGDCASNTCCTLLELFGTCFGKQAGVCD